MSVYTLSKATQVLLTIKGWRLSARLIWERQGLWMLASILQWGERDNLHLILSADRSPFSRDSPNQLITWGLEKATSPSDATSRSTTCRAVTLTILTPQVRKAWFNNQFLKTQNQRLSIHHAKLFSTKFVTHTCGRAAAYQVKYRSLRTSRVKFQTTALTAHPASNPSSNLWMATSFFQAMSPPTDTCQGPLRHW